jgi:hypothetical protein
MTEQEKHSFSHTPGEKVTIASPSPAGLHPGQGDNGPLGIHIERSPRPASSLSRLYRGATRTIPAKNFGPTSHPRSSQV